MRPIKFRAWDKHTKRMVAVKSIEFGNNGNVLLVNEYSDKRFVLLQYTNLKDKNGKEIYEGDIIEYSYPVGNTIGIVKFGYYDNGEYYEDRISGYGWYLELIKEYYSSVIILHPKEYPLDSYKFEVIGNIYENPELLKEG